MKGLVNMKIKKYCWPDASYKINKGLNGKLFKIAMLATYS